MSDQEPKSVQVNLRLNEVALQQMADLKKKLNVNRSAIMLQALAAYHREHCPNQQPPAAPPRSR